MNELKLELYSFQSDVVESFNVTLRALLISGRRVGKGYVSCVIAIIFCLACRDINVLIIGPTRQNVKSAFWNVLLKEILQDNIPVNLNKAELLLTFPNRSTIQLRGSDNEQKLRGISPTPDLIILDEFRELKPTLFDEIVSPMLNQNNFLLIVSTPDTVGSQLYDLWETYKDDPLWSVFKINGELARPDKAADFEELKAVMSPREYDTEIRANFNTLSNTVFYEFDLNVHVKRLAQLKQGETLHIAIDFNVDKMSAAAFVEREKSYEFIHEFFGAANTEILIKQIEEYTNGFNLRQIFVYPDPSGISRKSSAPVGQTDISLLKQAGFKVRVKSSAPTHKDSASTVNRLLRSADGQVRVWVDSRCTNTIASLSATKWKKQKPEHAHIFEIDKTQDVEHFSDAIRYALHYLEGGLPKKIIHRLTGFGTSL